MIDLLFKIFIVASGFSLMEFFAWFTHKYIMHGFLWSLHKDHHKKDHDSFFEKNDLFFIIFAAPGIFLLIYGLENGIELTLFLVRYRYFTLRTFILLISRSICSPDESGSSKIHPTLICYR